MILFVTGTDTGVGKTIASAWLARRFTADGKTVRYVKPAQTGVAPDEPGSDADIVASMTNIPVRECARFREPLAPSVAAHLEGRTIDVDELVRVVREEADACDVLLVEGAGGLLVPLTDDVTMAGFATRIGASLVVVARPGLGTLNHTALTLEAARARDLHVDRILLSGWPDDPDLTLRTNLEQLRRHDVPVETIPILPEAPA